MLAALDETASEHVLAAFDGTDFTSPLPQIPEIIRQANRMCEGELELVHSTPAAYFAALRKDLRLDMLQEYEGEMRFGPVNHVHSETMGTNTDIKQASWRAENAVLQVLEPLSVLLRQAGGRVDRDAHRLLWKYLLATQAHDSIHGSGDPKIKTDNLNRLTQVQALAESLIRRTINGICGAIRFREADGDIRVVVFNTTPYVRTGVSG